MPSRDELSAYYAYGHHLGAADDTVNLQERRLVMKTVLALRPRAETLLDIGCGFGHYLDLARARGLRAVGIEPDEIRASFGIQKGHEVLRGFFSPDALKGRRFDVVVLSHVIEHMPHPDTLLHDIRRVLNPNGLLAIICPNHDSLRARICKLRFNCYAPPEHVGYFCRSSLARLCERMGYGTALIRSLAHPLQVKDLLAFLLYMRFRHKVQYLSPSQDVAPTRFVERRGRPFRKPAYGLVLMISRSLVPINNLLGGDHLHGYFSLIDQV
jgi:SAM-dependent methyltransferase